jgi:hypothetical protein
MVTDAEAIRAAIALLEQVSQGRTVEEAQKEADRWRGSADMNEELLADWALEAARALPLLNSAPPAPGVPGVPAETPHEAFLAAAWAAQAYEPEATAAVISKPGALGSVLVETARRAVAAAYPVIAAAERERLYAELGNDHYVIFTEDGWAVEHSITCRLSGHMHECAYHAAIREIADGYDPGSLGRWKITDIDSEGLPSFERGEAPSGQ